MSGTTRNQWPGDLTAPGIAYSYAVPQPGLAPSHHKSDYQRYQAAWHAAHCHVEECDWCQHLCAEGLVIACDDCGCVHHTDWLGWEGEVDAAGRCTVLCPDCSPEIQTGAEENPGREA